MLRSVGGHREHTTHSIRAKVVVASVTYQISIRVHLTLFFSFPLPSFLPSPSNTRSHHAILPCLSLPILTKSEHCRMEKLVSDALIGMPSLDELLQKVILWRVHVCNEITNQTNFYVNALPKYQQTNQFKSASFNGHEALSCLYKQIIIIIII